MARARTVDIADDILNSIGEEEQFQGKKRKYYEMLTDIRDKLVDDARTLANYSLTSSKQAGEELADIGSDNFLREMELDLMSEEGRRIQQIQDAIRRLKDNQYGICLDCDQEIPEGRLEAIPYASLCVQCKSVRESVTPAFVPTETVRIME